MDIVQRVFSLLESKNESQKKLADFLKISQQGVSNWKERRTDPPAKLISPIADFFGVSVEWLLKGDEHSSDPEEILPASVQEKALLGVFRALPPVGRAVAIKQIVALVEAFPEDETAAADKIPEHSQRPSDEEKEDATA